MQRSALLQIPEQDGTELQRINVPIEKLADKTFIMEMISIHAFALRYAHESLQSDKDVVRAAASQYIETLKFASDELLADKAFIMEMISIHAFALRYAHESLQGDKELRLAAVMHDARALDYIPRILSREKDGATETGTLLATAFASPNGELPTVKKVLAGQEHQHSKKTILTTALRLAITSSSPCRLPRFLKQHGHEAAYFYHNTLGDAEKDTSESTSWTGHHAALLHAIDTDKLSLLGDAPLQEVPWPQKTVASNDPFLFALWNAVQSIDRINHQNLYFTLYFRIMDCLSADTEDVLHLESALARTLSTIERLNMYVTYLLSDELLKTLETIYDDVNLYQRHLTISTDKQGEQAATIVPWHYKPINDLLTKVIEAYQGFHGRYKRITRKQSVETNAPCTADDLQKIEYELIHLQSCIRGKDHSIFNAICCTINPHRDHLSSQSVFAISTSSAIPSCEETLIESTQSPAKRQKTS